MIQPSCLAGTLDNRTLPSKSVMLEVFSRYFFLGRKSLTCEALRPFVCFFLWFEGSRHTEPADGTSQVFLQEVDPGGRLVISEYSL